MRSTLHMVAAADVRWLLRIFGARNAARGAGRRKQLGLYDDLCDRALTALPQVLEEGRRTRGEIVARLAGLGVAIDGSGQAPAHLLLLAASRGVVCRGPETDGDEPTYVLLDDWVPPDTPSVAQAACRATAPTPRGRRATMDLPRAPAIRPTPISAASPPATSRATARRPRSTWRAGADCRWGWRGGRSPRPPTSWRSPPTSGRCRCRRGARSPPDPGPAAVRLLGHFDGYLLAYRDRTLSVDPAHDRAVQTGGGFVMPTVVVDGRAVATWRTTGQRVSVTPFGTLSATTAEGVDAEVADIARFLDRPVRWDL